MMSQSSTLSMPSPASMSMREKSQLKRRINKEHNSNFRAGYVPVNEVYLQKAGIRGRKRFLLYTCFVVLLVVAVLNTALTAWLMWIYHITHQGMEPMEFTHTSAGQLLRFLDRARFDSLVMRGTYLGSRHNKSLVFSGVDSKFVLSAFGDRNESTVEVKKDLVRLTVDNMKLLTPSGEQYFSLDQLKIPQIKNLKNLQALVVETKEVRNAPNFEDLSIESWDQIQITGSEGVKVTSKKETDIQAQHVFMNATNGSIILDGRVGMYISQSLPQVPRSSPVDLGRVSAKVCVCRQTGRVFAVPITQPGLGCHTANEQKNPCLD